MRKLLMRFLIFNFYFCCCYVFVCFSMHLILFLFFGNPFPPGQTHRRLRIILQSPKVLLRL